MVIVGGAIGLVLILGARDERIVLEARVVHLVVVAAVAVHVFRHVSVLLDEGLHKLHAALLVEESVLPPFMTMVPVFFCKKALKTSAVALLEHTQAEVGVLIVLAAPAVWLIWWWSMRMQGRPAC